MSDAKAAGSPTEGCRGLLETSAAWIWETDGNLRHTYTNAFITKSLGYQPEEFLGADTLELVHPDDRALVKGLVEKAVATGEGWRGEIVRWRHKDGSWRHIETSGCAVFDAAGKCTGLRGLDRDVTEHLRADEALRESEERFKALTENTSDWIWEVDENARYTYSNPRVRDILGYEPHEVIGRSAFEFMPPEEAARIEGEFVGRARAGEALRGLVNINRHRDGHQVVLETSGVPILDAEGRVRGYRGIDRDVTERRLLEEERVKTQKLESIGTLAGGIAHDFNNLLQGVFGCLSLLRLSLDDRQKTLEILDQAEKALYQSVNLTTQLLTFAKGGKPVMKVIELRPVVENAVKLALSGARIGFSLQVDEDLCAVEADEGQIGRVVQNLVLNAEQAMPLGGRIEVLVRNAPARGGDAAAVGPGAVEISVRDSGIGIPPELLPRIFEPYFTNKERGSGLGLATSYSIIRNHGGEIRVQSEPKKGSTFTVSLPASAAAAERPAAVKAEQPVCGTARILVMDDEEMVRRVAAQLLQALGHEATVASSGDEAIALYAAALAAGRPFDVVILDLTIRGGMGGEEALRGLRKIDPAVRAVVSSGYSDDEGAAAYRERGFRACLKKPYTIVGLSRVLAEAFG
jgi:PAS domain S-box-containing protein